MSTWPPKTNYAAGDILTAAQMTDIGNQMTPLGYTAGKNKIINGDFGVNQRAFSSTTTSGTYGFDRFYVQTIDGTSTYSAQTFTAGTAPVAGYEATNFARLVSTGQTLATAQTSIRHNIEDVRTFAGQTVTFSFWAKASTGTPNIAAELVQSFGSGGSTAVTGIISSKTAITSSWARYTFTATVPSISGKTIGTGSYLQIILWTSAGTDFNARTGSLGIQSVTIDIWGVQLEAGSVATAFQTATGTKQGELAACQRYYARWNYESSDSITNAYCYSTTAAIGVFPISVPMRVQPAISGSAGSTFIIQKAGGSSAVTAVAYFDVSPTSFRMDLTSSSLTAGQGIIYQGTGGSTYLEASAEL